MRTRTDAQRARHAELMRRYRAEDRRTRELDLGNPTTWQLAIVTVLVVFTLIVLAWTGGIECC